MAWPLPRCPTKALTGLDCPACGGLRMVHDLLHGDVRAALQDNAFLLLLGPSLLVLARSDAPGGHTARRRYGIAGAALLWMLVRNLPSWPLQPRNRPRHTHRRG